MTSQLPLTVVTHWNQGEALVTICGELDFLAAADFSARLASIITRQPRRIVLDLSGMAFIDMSGVRALIKLIQALPTGCKVVVRSPNETVRRLLLMSGLAGWCQVEDSGLTS